MTPERAHVYWNGTFSEAQKRESAAARNFPPALNSVLGELRDRRSRGLESAMIWRRICGSIKDTFFPTIF
jgi:hypothetical protein